FAGFLSQYDSPDHQWGLNVFYDDAVETFSGSSAETPFTKSRQDLMTGLSSLRGSRNHGNTYFKPALENFRAVIEKDLQLDQDPQTKYLIYFLSDGGNLDGFDLPSHIQKVMDLAPSRIFINTGFYGDSNIQGEVGEGLMRSLAHFGKGEFFDLRAGDSLIINPLLLEKDYDPWELQEFMVYNLNAGFCLDGKIDSDSDSDGLCDRDELALIDKGFSPTNRFSFDDGYGDYFHWRRLVFRELHPECLDRSDDDHDLLTNCEEKLIRNDLAQNNLLGELDPRNPDSDGDGLIDGLEVLVFGAYQFRAPLNPFNGLSAYLDPEGVDALTQIKEHRNPLMFDPEARRNVFDLRPTGFSDQGQACYSYSHSELPLYPAFSIRPGRTLAEIDHGKHENSILVYKLQRRQRRNGGHLSYQFSIQRRQLPELIFPNGGAIDTADPLFQEYLFTEEKP
ncbi:MAG: hypothetical protein KDD68_18840, partial [Bdellovibrionales bacterium]|nr:hypothetical protein [Bdellovibrionales bacterium]